MTKEFSITLTGKQQWDLWLFCFRYSGVKPRDRDQVRSLDAVCEAFGVSAIQSRVEALQDAQEGTLGPKDVEPLVASVGSVDLKRLIEYLGTMPEGIDTALALRLLRISDLLSDAKDRKPAADDSPLGGAVKG